MYVLQHIFKNNPHFAGSCPEFGVSGSGIVREWKKRNTDGAALDEATGDPNYRYSFVGPLSMSKGCDLTADFSGNRQLEDEDEELGDRIPEFVYRGKNKYEEFIQYMNEISRWN